MQNMKSYSKYLNEAGLLGTKQPVKKKKNPEISAPKLKSKIDTPETNLDEGSLLKTVADKISNSNNSPIYVYNKLSGNSPYYVGENLIKNAEKFGMTADDSRTLSVDNSKLFYIVLDCDLLKSQTSQEIELGFQNLYMKNSSSGKSTLTEFSNFSSASSDVRSLIISAVTNRKIGDYKLKSSEFFIVSDNSNSQNGGKNVSKVISGLFPETGISAFSQSFYEDTENTK